MTARLGKYQAWQDKGSNTVHIYCDGKPYKEVRVTKDQKYDDLIKIIKLFGEGQL